MNDRELRVKALELAVATPGNPNKLDIARDYIEFVTAGEAAAKKTDALQTKVKK